ncbi:MAG: 4-hydroxythreonine-4-phosphate dehydrogenase PdxA, partial [Planctomycetota bacterium]|nr:4-hydroxythreonine-4-phosphate dehydrogenase PdxA [Planctomycetota bacterium]
ITLGLPIIRTSPTHGTAFDRAWNPQTPADAAGMVGAIRIAAELAKRHNPGGQSPSGELKSGFSGS